MKIYYDGKCHLCAKEVKIYHKQNKEKALEFVDIMNPSFSPEAEGLDPNGVHQRFHIKTDDGRILEGVEAFREIWSKLPQWKWAHKASGLPMINYAMRVGYRLFTKIRPHLPRRKESIKL